MTRKLCHGGRWSAVAAAAAPGWHLVYLVLLLFGLCCLPLPACSAANSQTQLYAENPLTIALAVVVGGDDSVFEPNHRSWHSVLLYSLLTRKVSYYLAWPADGDPCTHCYAHCDTYLTCLATPRRPCCAGLCEGRAEVRGLDSIAVGGGWTQTSAVSQSRRAAGPPNCNNNHMGN
jgi:hypothetical protein